MEALPCTGRIGRFVKIVRAETDADADAQNEILAGAETYPGLAEAEKSAWWNAAVGRMEKRLGKDRAVRMMHKCGEKCCGAGQRRTAARLYRESANLEAFLRRIGKHDVKEGDLTYTLQDEHTVIAEHNRCFCRQVASGREPFDGLTYCQCSVAFNMQFFTAALGREVRVELLQSIVCGAKSCKFRITF